jgi:bacteriorhodopsin
MTLGGSLSEIVFFHTHRWGYPGVGLGVLLLILIVVLLTTRESR